jgi:hypothetical protein
MFNAQDFQEEIAPSTMQRAIESVDASQDEQQIREHTHGKRSKEKKQRRRKGDAEGVGLSSPAGNSDGIEGSDSGRKKHHTVSPNSKVKRSKKERKAELTNELLSSPIKKRKRHSDAALSSSVTELNGSYNGNSQSSATAEGSIAQDTSQPEKKKTKKKRKSEIKTSEDEQPVNKPFHPFKNHDERSNGPSPESGLGRKNEVKVQEGKKKKKLRENLEPSSSVTMTSSPPIHGPAKQTPVPLLPPSGAAFSTVPRMQQDRAKAAMDNDEVLVPETPPTVAKHSPRVFIKTPVPSPSLIANKPTDATPKSSKKEREALIQAEMVPRVKTPLSAPAAAGKREKKLHSKSRSAKPTRFTAVLNDEPKAKPRPRLSRSNSVSSATSSSLSIPELFNRVGMPYSRSGASIDPFVTPESKKVKKRETHEEAELHIFKERFTGLQKSVNFSHEQEYLNQYLDWHDEQDSEYPFPCMGNTTGCTPKKEEILRSGKKENMNVSKLLGHVEGDESALVDADQRSIKAVEFLTMAMRARVPVPIGQLQGTWTLYCPKYSVNHFDRYGYGGRTLTISSIAGFKDKNQYTARLSIPPRTTAFSILTFKVPPHASFRTNTLKTATEGYTIDVVFLGNGFLQLRVDLNLLLKGKPTEMVGGKKVWMEFVGVHEKALEWVVKKDEQEEEYKQLFGKYADTDSD